MMLMVPCCAGSPEMATAAAARMRTLVAGNSCGVGCGDGHATALDDASARSSCRGPSESYINGVHIFNQPQPWLFPLFPWSAFAFAGLAVGFFLFSDLAKRKEALAFAALGGAGILACALSVFSILHPSIFTPSTDYWHSNPDFFLMRCGILLIILFLVYAWCRWGFAQKGFSPIIQLGKTSLLVYWVHIEFVYGKIFHPAERAVAAR